MKQTKKRNVIAISLLIPLIATLLLISSYGNVKHNVEESNQHSLEAESSLNVLAKGTYVLYKSLYEKRTGSSIPYSELYINNINNVLDVLDYGDYLEIEDGEIDRYLEILLKKNFEQDFSELIKFYDFYAEDETSHTIITNSDKDKIEDPSNYCFYIEYKYDENGTPIILNAKSNDTEQLMRNASEGVLIKNELLADSISYYSGFPDIIKTDLLKEGKAPVNSKFIYAMTTDTWAKFINAKNTTYQYFYGTDTYNFYANNNLVGWLCITFFGIIILIASLPLYRKNGKQFHDSWYFSLPIEVIIFILFLLAAFMQNIIYTIISVLNGDSASNIHTYFHLPVDISNVLSYVIHGFLLMGIFTISWYIGLNFHSLREDGLKKYFTTHCLIYRLFPFCKKQFKRLFFFLEHLDVTKKANKTILKIVLINGAMMLLISLLWFGGIMFTIVYSVALYFILKIYASRMQKKYIIMMDKISEISAGNLNVEIKEDLGIFNPFKEQLLNIEDGFRNAVGEEVKSQKLKSELITNVSHDLKTPLTAIITYINLLNNDNLTNEQRKEYLDTLEKKSLRLKVLIEDLFEVSKATSGNVTMHYMDVDLINLIKQVELEMSDKLAEASLEVRMELPNEKVICSLDSQKTYRIYANLFSNICKYSLPNTRVYVHGTVTDKDIIISMKNISATEITIQASQLTERFVRGDYSRNTEGSGLGLAIVKSFTELQNGKLILENDGDLFKAITMFPRKL